MGEHDHQRPQLLLGVLPVLLAQFLKVACTKKSMKCEGTIFCVVQMRNARSQANWLSVSPDETLASQIFNGKAEVMEYLVLRLDTSEVNAWLRQQ
jgi:hypothetical protein